MINDKYLNLMYRYELDQHVPSTIQKLISKQIGMHDVIAKSILILIHKSSR